MEHHGSTRKAIEVTRTRPDYRSA
uniref:Uncharacterized protein n=1 Tax=Arundo donax TaxID=35708 RepID=A0A0A9BQP1_ARUDO